MRIYALDVNNKQVEAGVPQVRGQPCLKIKMQRKTKQPHKTVEVKNQSRKN